MTVIDFHPEDLLERESSGALSAAERRRLDDHLARCASCRIERQLRLDFEQELGPQAAPGLLHALVSGALRAARAPEQSAPLLSALPRARRSRQRFATLLAAGIALGTGLAAARPDVAVRAFDFAREQARLLLGQAPPPPAKTTTRAPAPAPRDPPTLSSAPSELALPPAVLDGEESSRAGVQRAARAQHALPGRGTAPKSPEARRSVPGLEATRLFDRANAARRGGSGAEALYRELQTRFPDSPEARLSQAILGRMKLDSGDSEAAVVHFESYLSTGERALREQAMAGCALAWERLGRADRERQSWRALLAAYPDSSYALHARQRLAREAP